MMVTQAPFQVQPVLIRPMPPPVFHVASHSEEPQSRSRRHMRIQQIALYSMNLLISLLLSLYNSKLQMT